MRLEPLYMVTFTTPEAWSAQIATDAGTEGCSFLLAEGRSTRRLSARYRAANFPRKRSDGALVPEFRGVLETDDGATILFEWRTEIAVLEDLRMAAIEEQINAHLALGRHAGLVGKLEGLTAEQPLPRGGRQGNARHLARARLELRGHCIVPTPLVLS